MKKYSRATYLVPAGERRQAIVQQTTVAEKEMLLLLVAVGGHRDEEEHLMVLITLSVEVTSLGETDGTSKIVLKTLSVSLRFAAIVVIRLLMPAPAVFPVSIGSISRKPFPVSVFPLFSKAADSNKAPKQRQSCCCFRGKYYFCFNAEVNPSPPAIEPFSLSISFATESISCHRHSTTTVFVAYEHHRCCSFHHASLPHCLAALICFSLTRQFTSHRRRQHHQRRLLCHRAPSSYCLLQVEGEEEEEEEESSNCYRRSSRCCCCCCCLWRR